MTDDAFERAADREEAERRERRGHGARAGFRIHLTVFIAVQLLLVVIWAMQWALGGTSHPWFLYALFGWGIGVAAHYAAVRDRIRAGRAAPS